MLGHPAASHTVCSPFWRTRFFSSRNDGPIVALVRIHGGLRSIGVWLLRTSRRSSRRSPASAPGLAIFTSATLRGIRRHTGELGGAFPEQPSRALLACGEARRHTARGAAGLPERGWAEVLAAVDISRCDGVELR